MSGRNYCFSGEVVDALDLTARLVDSAVDPGIVASPDRSSSPRGSTLRRTIEEDLK